MKHNSWYDNWFAANCVDDIGFRGGKVPPVKVSVGNYKMFPVIEKVIFNPPATIVFWEDGTKTIVKCMENTEFDKWTGLSMCIAKKIYGKKFKKEFNKWCKNE